MTDYTDLANRLVRSSEALHAALDEALLNADRVEVELQSLNVGIRCSIEISRGTESFRFGYSKNKTTKTWGFYIQDASGEQFPLRDAPVALQIQACQRIDKLLLHMAEQADLATRLTRKAISTAEMHAAAIKGLDDDRA